MNAFCERRSAILALVLFSTPASLRLAHADDQEGFLGKENLVAWCIVPFDAKKRDPKERVQMLKQLGFKKYAYDWRAEHLPTLDMEIEELKNAGIELAAVWFPTTLDDDAKRILDSLKRSRTHTQLWVMGGGLPTTTKQEQVKRVQTEVDRLTPIVKAAAEIGCQVGLYNHGGWFGEPENQIEIIEALKASGVTNVGIVYNLHHGHDHLAKFEPLLERMSPHLLTLNLNGMDVDGEKRGRKILVIGHGEEDERILKPILAAKYRGPIGIIGHTSDDAEARLRDNLDGLDWLRHRSAGETPAQPKLRTMDPGR